MQEIKIQKLNFDFKIFLNLCTAIILTLHLLHNIIFPIKSVVVALTLIH